MDFINVLMVFVGIVAVFAGIYELAKRTVIGRNVKASTPEQIKKFSVADGIFYILEGISVILMAFEDHLPFVNSNAIAILIAALLVADMIAARKLLNNFSETP